MELQFAGPGRDDIRIDGTYKTGDLRLLLVTLEAGFPLLAERFRRPHVYPTQTPEDVVQPLI